MAFPALRSSYRSWEEAVRQITIAVNAILQGRSNAVGTVTLRPNETTTTISDPRIGADSKIFLTPTSANAVSQDSYVYVSAVAAGSATLTHDNNAASDRSFDYAIQG